MTDPNRQVTEMVGSGPYRFVTGERVPGSRVVYEKFAGYVPRADQPATFTSGPKVAHFDRVEWHVIPDSATAVNALVNGEVDWVQNPATDLMEVIRKNPRLATLPDVIGGIAVMRFNHLLPPFDNPLLRRARRVVGALNAASSRPSLSTACRRYCSGFTPPVACSTRMNWPWGWMGCCPSLPWKAWRRRLNCWQSTTLRAVACWW